LKITNVTAYCIKGDLYYRRGKPNAKQKKIILDEIQKGQIPQKWGFQENQSLEKRGVSPKTSGCNSAKYETKKEKIGDLLSWLQT
jgi:hypothetical protein